MTSQALCADPLAAVPDAAESSGDARVDAVLRGIAGAWQALSWNLHAEVIGLCRRRRWTAPDVTPIDHHHDVALATIDRIAADDFRALRAFAAASARYAAASFPAWMTAVAASVHVDLCRRAGVRRRDGDARRTEAVVAVELDEADGATAGDLSAHLDVARATAHVESPSFPAEQRAALAMWLRGESPAEIAAALGLPHAAAASRLLHAARERLRRWAHRGGGQP
jgi:DNA-directed RNA polymerase specialized sigma24 family protein